MIPAPAFPPPPSLESAAVHALALAARAAEDPLRTLAGDADPARKRAALEAAFSSMPRASLARRKAILAALAATAENPGEDPGVRARAYERTGYAVPVLAHPASAEPAVRALLRALPDPVYRLHALRGLAPASHDLSPAVEAEFQDALLDLLDAGGAPDERIVALLALDGFVRSREDLPARRPELVAGLEARLLVPLEADPAALVAARPAGERALVVAVLWHSARRRGAYGDAAAWRRTDALLAALKAVESDAGVRAEIDAYLSAPPPEPAGF